MALDNTEESSAAMQQRINDFLRMAGQAINNAALYGPSHKIATQSMLDSYNALAAILSVTGRINLSVVDDELLVEASPIDIKNPFVKMFSDKLIAVGVTGFTLLQGMPQAEYEKLMAILIAAKGEGESDGFIDQIEENQLQYVEAERVKYERVTESETVVEKESLEEAETEEGVGTAAIEQIMAFLKGDVGVEVEKWAEDLSELATDADRLANLIMEATAIRQQQSGVADGESLADIVVGCLRRTFEGLVKDPAARTKKGKATVKKTMLMLEKSVLDKLHAISGAADPSLDEAIANAVEEMVDDLEVDALTADYVRKRKALEETETRVLKYMKSHGEDPGLSGELETRLTDAGLTPEGWKELVVKSGAKADAGEGKGMGDGGSGTDPASMGVLAMLLSELDDMMAGGAGPGALSGKLAEVERQAEEVAAVAEERIESFKTTVQEQDANLVGLDDKQQSRIKMSRQSMMEVLAEIVQELCQSVSAINCTVGMIYSEHIGAINEDQHQVLSVAVNCGHRLGDLLGRIIAIVGVPKGLKPEKERVYGSEYEEPAH